MRKNMSFSAHTAIDHTAITLSTAIKGECQFIETSVLFGQDYGASIVQ